TSPGNDAGSKGGTLAMTFREVERRRTGVRRQGCNDGRVKIAIVSDVHGNLVALEAVLEDLEQAKPDLVVHGGDLAWRGPRPVECVDRIRELGWPGVIGNMDRALDTHRHEGSIAWPADPRGPDRA